jgi:hypothetical protein
VVTRTANATLEESVATILEALIPRIKVDGDTGPSI